MKVNIFFKQMDLCHKTTVTYRGSIELTNFDILDTCPYIAYEDEQTNIFDYLTAIGKAKVMSFEPANELVTDYIVIISEKKPENTPVLNALKGYMKLQDNLRNAYDSIVEKVEKKTKNKIKHIDLKKINNKSLSDFTAYCLNNLA